MGKGKGTQLGNGAVSPIQHDAGCCCVVTGLAACTCGAVARWFDQRLIALAEARRAAENAGIAWTDDDFYE